MSHENLLLAVIDAKHSKQMGDGTGKPMQRLTDRQLRQLGIGRTKPIEAAPTHEEKVPACKCQCLKGLLRRKASRKPCKTCGGKVERAERRYFELGNRDRVTCPALFCQGEDESQGFSRTIAVRYLSKRMVFGAKGASKDDAPDTTRIGSYGERGEAKADPATTVRGRKTSSSRHALPFFKASDIEDIVNDAWLIYIGHTLTRDGKPYIVRTGNRLHDSCNAARKAHTLWQQAEHLRRKTLDCVAVRATTLENSERSRRNITWDDEAQKLIALIAELGTADQATLAGALGISQQAVSKRLDKIRSKVG